jgi:hypothetical protein
MLKIHKSYTDNGYIVYDQHNFDKYHTHTRHLRIAIIIRNNVNKLRLPKSRDKRLIESHIRVSNNKSYTIKLELILKEIEENKNRGGAIDGKFARYK